MTTEVARPLTDTDFAFWMEYCDSTVEEIAELASISVGKADWIVAGPDAAYRDLDALAAAVREAAPGSTLEETAARAGVSVERFRFIYDGDPADFDDFLAVRAVVGQLIDTRARAKLIAFGEAHGVPGFEVDAGQA